MFLRSAFPEPVDPARQPDEDAPCYRQILHELIDMGANLARAIHHQVTAEPGAAPGSDSASQPGPVPVLDLSIAFDDVARAIHRAIAFARKITEFAPPSITAQPSERRLAARKRVIRKIEDAIQRRANGAEADALNAEVREHLDSLDLDDDRDQRPPAEVIADICRDLGIAARFGKHPWKRRTPRDVRDLCARAARPSIARNGAD